MQDQKETRKWCRIDTNGYQEVIDRIRHPLFIIRDDISRDKITKSTHIQIEKIFDFLQEMGNEEIWQIQDADSQDGKLHFDF